MVCSKAIGVGLRPPHYKKFLNGPPKYVSWVEVISENFMDWGPSGNSSLKTLLKIREEVPVSLHGVSLSIGSADELNGAYLRRLKELIDIVEPFSVSDHLCWTGVDGENLHDLMPMPLTNEASEWICQKLEKVQDFLGREIMMENVSSYLEFPENEMSEVEFLKEVTRKSGCGLLLDINNVFVNSVNHNFSALDYLRSLPLERIRHVHLAGHLKRGSLLVDTHGTPVCLEVWKLYRHFCGLRPTHRAMIERDENIPSWEEMEDELKTIERIQKEGENGDSLALAVAAEV